MSALWLDANVVLRLLTGDPPDAAAGCLRLFEKAERGELLLRLSHLALAEVVWVLVRFHKVPKDRVARHLVSLVAAPGVSVEEPDLVLGALFAMAEKNVDFADALLAAQARTRGEGVATLDRDFLRLGVDVVDPGTIEG
jgi:predicted nucleic acid-binding protein